MGVSPPPEDGSPIDRLRAIMATLRSPEGCPWDREQTLATLKPFLVEETYEVLDAIDDADRGKLCEELGDLLLQIVFQAQLASEEGAFDFDDVARSITEKLLRRHPHVFGDVAVADAAEVLQNWDAIKKSEARARQGSTSALSGIPRSLPALQKAHEMQKRAARQGFDWQTVEPVLDKVEEEFAEFRRALREGGAASRAAAEELGDILFSLVNVSRFLGHPPEDLLHRNVEKFRERFQALEDRVHAQGRGLTECTMDELDAIWDQVKRAQRAADVPTSRSSGDSG